MNDIDLPLSLSLSLSNSVLIGTDAAAAAGGGGGYTKPFFYPGKEPEGDWESLSSRNPEKKGYSSLCVQGSVNEWSLGCVKRAPAATGSKDAGIAQPRDHSLANPCSLHDSCAMVSSGRGCAFHATILY